MAAVPRLPAQSQAPTLALVDQLGRGFREQVRRTIGCELDHSATSLAFVDHYLGLARGESREPILTLLAAGAGAYFGEVVRREIGGTWIGDGRDPRRLRVLLEPQFLHFSPVDVAWDVLRGSPPEGGSEGAYEGLELDAAFALRRRPVAAAGVDRPASVDDASWVEQRLEERAPVPESDYYSLTGRYETLALILELLAHKHLAEGQKPEHLSLDDYLAELVGDGA